MEKVSLGLVDRFWSWFWSLIELLSFVAWKFWAYVGFELCFVKIDCEYLSDPWSQNPWSKKCVGSKELLEGILQHQAIGCILLFISLIQIHFFFPI